MSTFKVGDKLVRTEGSHMTMSKGDVVEVIGVSAGFGGNGLRLKGHDGIYDEEYFKLVEEKKVEHKFKVGDVVKLTATEYPDGTGGGVLGRYNTSAMIIERLIPVGEMKSALWDDGTPIYQTTFGNCTESMIELVNSLVEEHTSDSPKSLLKDWMKVKLRNGNVYIVCGDTLVSSNDGWDNLGAYEDDLTINDGDNSLDIVEVYKAQHGYAAIKTNILGELVWERIEESEEEKAKRLQKESLEADVAKMTQTLKEMQEKLANLS